MRRSLSVKATYDGVVRLPMSLAMISTLRERKTRASKFLFRQSSSSSSSSIARVIVPIIAFPALGRDEISRGRRRNAARVATRPRPVLPPARTTDRTTHTKKPRVPSRASRVASPPTTARPSSLSPPCPSSSSIEIAASAEKNAPSTTPSRARLERTDRVARHRRTNTSCRDRSRSRDLQPYS